MKKTVFKVLSIIMALCVFLGAMPIVTFAEDNVLNYTEEVKKIDFSPNVELDATPSINANKFYSTSTQVDTSKYFYNQLTSAQKSMYNQLWQAHQNSYANNTIDGTSITVVFDLTDVTISGTGILSSTAENNAIRSAQQNIIMAISALFEDNPMYFGIGGYSTILYNGTKKGNTGNYTYTLSYLSVDLEIDTAHYTSPEDIKAKADAVIEKIATIKVNGISYHEKLKSIHDYITNNMVYDMTIAEPNIFDVYGAFVNGLCVCEGYAEATKMLCDREGIPCITVVGTGSGGAHKWNMVQMEDGEWYTFDSTWDDQEDYIFYNYFLIGSNTKTPNFHSEEADSTIHIPTGKLFTSANVALSYPTLSYDTYGIGMLRYDAQDVHFDKSRGVVMVGKDVSSYLLSIVSDSTSGFSRTRNGTGITTSTLTVSDSTTTKTYLVAMRGDIDASNTTNATDYNKITQVCATTHKVDDGTAKFYAGDMNQDGAIDGFDAIALELYMNDDLKFD